jgi:hypothetical protein
MWAQPPGHVALGAWGAPAQDDATGAAGIERMPVARGGQPARSPGERKLRASLGGLLPRLQHELQLEPSQTGIPLTAPGSEPLESCSLEQLAHTEPQNTSFVRLQQAFDRPCP